MYPLGSPHFLELFWYTTKRSIRFLLNNNTPHSFGSNKVRLLFQWATWQLKPFLSSATAQQLSNSPHVNFCEWHRAGTYSGPTPRFSPKLHSYISITYQTITSRLQSGRVKFYWSWPSGRTSKNSFSATSLLETGESLRPKVSLSATSWYVICTFECLVEFIVNAVNCRNVGTNLIW